MTRVRGKDILRNPTLNKGTGFTAEERDGLGLRGLLPYNRCSQKVQMERILGHLRRKDSDIERYIALNALQDRNEQLYFRVLMEHVDELMPIVYTPTVGEACREFASIYRRPKGFYVTPDDREHVRSMLDNWPEDDVRVIVVTDGERILGLGDLGANGMGIPIGKLALYVALAGIHPSWCLPVMLDVGTGNDELLDDPLYMGWPHARVRGQAYDALMEEFIDAATDRWPHVLIQFEDFETTNALRLLNIWRDRIRCFNDDIQGTAAVTLSGVMAATRVTGTPLEELRVLFVGAGSAATGIGHLMASALIEQGLSKAEAFGRLWFVDSKGLIVKGRGDQLAAHKKPFAHDHAPMQLEEALDDIRPHVLIGATGTPGTFTESVVRRMAAINERPGIFALSNPTSQAECTAEEAYAWSDGRALFASGSPFAPVEYGGQTFHPAQGNNAYIFPGVGLGAVACGARRITDTMFMAAAKRLASLVSEGQLERGALYPPMENSREVSLEVAHAVAEVAYEEGLASKKRPEDLKHVLRELQYDPTY